MGHTYTKKLSVAYPQFKFIWVSCILFGNPSCNTLGIIKIITYLGTSMPSLAPSLTQVLPYFPLLCSSGTLTSFQPEGPYIGASVCLKGSFSHYLMPQTVLSLSPVLGLHASSSEKPSHHLMSPSLALCFLFLLQQKSQLARVSSYCQLLGLGCLSSVDYCAHLFPSSSQHLAQHPTHSRYSINV